MKFCISTLLIMMLLILDSVRVGAQGYLKAEGHQIVDESGHPIILRGMGLGGWMLQEGYMLQTASFANAQHDIKELIADLIGEDATETFYEAWLQNHVTREDIDSLKAWGFNSVRLPMHYNLFTLPIEQEPNPSVDTWLDVGFVLTDSLLSWCAANEMYLILDLHAAPGGQGRDEGISDYDDAKPSLWESSRNRSKTVALWKRIAERYKNESWIAGYDLINETNWPMDNNQPLRDLYLELTRAIREVDSKHILFIEGNWFANDFTNLTPPWDDNLVYSPHKYWSINDQASIQWVLDIREDHNVPLYFGESGENSNRWFRDAIKLFEGNDIGWAWWPMKKVESISGPLSVIKTDGYQRLLDYWEGNGTKPSATEAELVLMQLSELLHIENCIFQKDVVDAMFRQITSDETLPFASHQVPGLIYASDYDLGISGAAYLDVQDANYQVSTGNFSAWNNGWTYRNDGVDIEKSGDNSSLSNGFSVGWTSTGEWLQYSTDVVSGTYDVEIRVATERDNGQLHLRVGEAQISGSQDITSTGGWQRWSSVAIADVVLFDKDDHVRLYIEQEEFNIGSLEFVRKGATTSTPLRVTRSVTLDDETLVLDMNKPLDQAINFSLEDLVLTINGVQVPVSGVFIDPDNPRRLIVTLNTTIESSDRLQISSESPDIIALDGTKLSEINQLVVENNLATIHKIPGRVEAEEFFFQSGIQLESTSDIGGGQNIGFLDRGDYLDYEIDVNETGIYLADFRTAALSEVGGISLSLLDEGQATTLLESDFQATGDWQTWSTTSRQVRLPEGRHVMRLTITDPLFNLNWVEFSILTSDDKVTLNQQIQLSPSPSTGLLSISMTDITDDVFGIDVFSADGKLIYHHLYTSVQELEQPIDLSTQPDGLYHVRIQSKSGLAWQDKWVKISE